MVEVSVIINCLNGERYLREAIETVFAQTYKDWEIIFFDNNSTDASAAIAKSFGERVVYVRADKTGPLGWARERAFEKAQGRLLAILDSDDLWLPKKLEKMVPLFNDKRVGLAFSNSQYFSDTGDIETCFGPTRQPHRGSILKPLLKQNFISSETMMFSREHLNRMPKIFDESLTVVCDYDVTLRIADICQSEYTDEILSKWRVHATSVTSKRPYLAAHEMKHMIAELKKYLGGRSNDFAEEFRALDEQASYQIAREYFVNGHRLDAVTKLLPLCPSHPKWFVMAGLYALLPRQTFFQLMKRSAAK